MWHSRKHDVVERPSPKQDLSGLVEALSSSPDWKVRLEAAEKLGRIGDWSSRGALDAAKSDSRPEVRSAAFTAWGDVTQRYVEEKQSEGSIREQRRAERMADAYRKCLGNWLAAGFSFSAGRRGWSVSAVPRLSAHAR